MSILFYINIEEASARVHMAHLQHSEAQVPPPGSEGRQPAPQKHGSSGTDFYGAKALDLICEQMISCTWHQEGTPCTQGTGHQNQVVYARILCSG